MPLDGDVVRNGDVSFSEWRPTFPKSGLRFLAVLGQAVALGAILLGLALFIWVTAVVA